MYNEILSTLGYIVDKLYINNKYINMPLHMLNLRIFQSWAE